MQHIARAIPQRFVAKSGPANRMVGWEDVPGLKSGAQWTIVTAREHLSFQQADPWAGYWTSRQTLAGPMKKLGYRPK